MLATTSFNWLRNWFRPPRHLLALFLVITLVLAGALGWLSWRVLEQERALEGQRLQERLDNAADLASAALLRSLAQMEERLNRLLASPESQVATAAASFTQPEALLVTLTATNLATYPSGQLLYLPLPIPANESLATTFAQAEAAEFQQKDYARAIVALRALARSEDAAMRAGALLRLARNLRKAGQAQAALAAYDELAQLQTTLIEGYPARLLARHGRCVLWQELNERAPLQTEATLLYRELHQSSWPMSGAAYRFYAEAASGWLAPAEAAQLATEMHAPEALARAAGAEFLWEEWQRSKRGEGAGSGRLSLWHEPQAVFLLWRSTAERMVALIVSPRYFEQQWLSAMPTRGELRVRLALTDADGHPVLGNGAGTALPQALRTAAATQLPWTLHVVSTDARLGLGELAGRRSLWLGSLWVLGLLVLVGSYFIGRAVLRELEVARLQSDFVAAVSHEFRTPLTSICQLSELLADGRVSSEQRREEYYAGLRRESLRLQRLVEGLLDFGRMEAGAREYRFELCDTTTLVREVSDEFAHEVAERGYRIELNLADDLPCVRADREAFSRALWNLLDNASKYSPHCPTLWVEAESANGAVLIRVRDQGLGIAPAEQAQIFQKFVRGTSARTSAAKGTGLGLAMVQHIVTAHGGRVLCESVPEQGTTFTMVLPKAKE